MMNWGGGALKIKKEYKYKLIQSAWISLEVDTQKPFFNFQISNGVISFHLCSFSKSFLGGIDPVKPKETPED